ncbi:MAG: hypothetical protein H8D22_13195 [Candidatus Cloacimonetes bacterium]|nr:hypothetical protein [Candidatus Cloacimonadota bacterium]
MKSKYLILLFLFLFFTNTFSQEQIQIPEWVQRYQKGKPIKNASEYYFGIGVSNKSKSDADTKAREEFAKNIEIQVKCIQKDMLQEKNGRVWENFVSILEIVTDVNLLGINITEKFQNPKTGEFYSIIQVQKDEYNKIVYDELTRKLEKTIYESKIEEAKEQEGLRKVQAEFKLWLQKEKDKTERKIQKFQLKQKKKQEMKKMINQFKNEYGDFIKSKPPERVISFWNAELPIKNNKASLELGMNPFSIHSLYYAHKFWKLELSSYSEFNKNKFDKQDILLKYQVLPNSGAFYKTTVSLGFIVYDNEISDKNSKDIKVKYTPFITGNITLPNLHFSYISLYGDIRKYSIGIVSYALYGHLNDKLSVLLELDYIPDKDHRNRFNDSFLIQPGIRFKTAKNVYSTLAYKNNEMVTLSVDLTF